MGKKNKKAMQEMNMQEKDMQKTSMQETSMQETNRQEINMQKANTLEINKKKEWRNEDQKRKGRKESTAAVMLVEILSLVIGMFLLTIMNVGWGEHFIIQYIDVPAMILLVVLTLPVFIHSGLWKDFVRVFSLNQPEKHWKLSELKLTLEAVELLQRQFGYAALLVVLAQMVLLLHRMDDLATLGPVVSSMLLAGVYTAILEMLLMPLKVETKKKIINYMEEE